MSDTIFFISLTIGSIVILFIIIRLTKNEDIENKELESDYITNGESVDGLIKELKKEAGEDAVNFAHITEYDEWVCICSTVNLLDLKQKIQNCSKCHRNRDFALKNYAHPHLKNYKPFKKDTTNIKCPACGLYNPKGTKYCDCGLSFAEGLSREGDKKRTEAKQWHWRKIDARQPLMKISRWLLIFLGVVHIFSGYIKYSDPKSIEAQDTAIGMGFIGVVYVIAGFIPSFWFRLACIIIWVIDLSYTNFVMGRMRGSSFIYIIIGTLFAYKMWKYRNVFDEKDSFCSKKQELSTEGYKNKEKKANYFIRHWRGDLPLAVSLWFNGVLLTVFFRIFDALLPKYPINVDPAVWFRSVVVYSFIFLLVVYPWQVVGIWRSSVRYIKENRKGKLAFVAYALLIVSIFQTIVSLPAYKAIYLLAFGKDNYGNYTVSLKNKNSIIHLNGGMGHGVTKSINKVLENNPSVTGIVLDSIGGHVLEGRRLAKIIIDRGLNTYSFKGCYSICTVAFIAGKNRYLGRGANLGFHQYRAFKGLSKYIDIAKEQKTDLQLFQRQGVTGEFMEKLYKTPADDFWYPQLDEMLSANVVHGSVNQSEILPQTQSYKITISDINKGFLEIPVYKTIKKYSPETYEKIIAKWEDELKKGASFIDMQRSVISLMMEPVGKAMPISSDEALIEYVLVLTDTLKKLEEIDPILCLKYLFPKKYGAIFLGNYLADADRSSLLDVLSNIIIDAYEKNNQPVDTNAAEALSADIVLKLGEEIQYIQLQGLENSADYKRACDGIIKFYKLIIAEDKVTAGNTLRYISK